MTWAQHGFLRNTFAAKLPSTCLPDELDALSQQVFIDSSVSQLAKSRNGPILTLVMRNLVTVPGD